MNEQRRDATEAKIVDVLRGMPEITEYRVTQEWYVELRDGYVLVLIHANDNERMMHVMPIEREHIRALHPYALREHIRTELGGDWPLDDSPRRAWEKTVLMAMGCPEGQRDRPWIAISAGAVLDAEARITDD